MTDPTSFDIHAVPISTTAPCSRCGEAPAVVKLVVNPVLILTMLMLEGVPDAFLCCEACYRSWQVEFSDCEVDPAPLPKDA